MTNNGRLTIAPEVLDTLDQTTCIACQFTDKEQRQFAQFPMNPHNGKWSVISYDPEKALDELERGLSQVGARPLTDEERAAWEAEDARWNQERIEFLAERLPKEIPQFRVQRNTNGWFFIQTRLTDSDPWERTGGDFMTSRAAEKYLTELTTNPN